MDTEADLGVDAVAVGTGKPDRVIANGQEIDQNPPETIKRSRHPEEAPPLPARA
ncbi:MULTISPECIES: hypothetical protein [unclassified Streptomyces]|uniref:hypothetical protein n=1 Tax=unclassified Streptomyces TaxID=2593676 RepID=UPI001BEB7FC8|nr:MULTISPECIES: hypothetical protein [unclassified Streptomyces]MBT3073236.1 hypothetical protein [Streptomyces sp. COG21]MBT3100445.1 hypothetical protein [Streptomyces sp. CBG30]